MATSTIQRLINEDNTLHVNIHQTEQREKHSFIAENMGVDRLLGLAHTTALSITSVFILSKSHKKYLHPRQRFRPSPLDHKNGQQNFCFTFPRKDQIRDDVSVFESLRFRLSAQRR